LEDDSIDAHILNSSGAANYHWAQTLIGDTRTTGANRYYHADALGTTRAITNSSQTKTDTLDTDAFGLTVARTGSTSPFSFQFGAQSGYWTYQATGLLRLGARHYDPSTGRFLSRDPMRSGYNWYTYCQNDPVNRVDPDGKLAIVAGGAIGGSLGGPVGALIGIAVVAIAVGIWYWYEHRPAQADTPAVPPPPIDNWTDKAQPPNNSGDWEWRGKGEPGSGNGNWHNPDNGQSMNPDFDHAPPIGPHWDWKDGPGKGGEHWRIYPDGRVEPKYE
jgi:RHS repeat-associated protein